MEGGDTTGKPIPLEYRTFRICKLMGWTPGEAGDVPAALIDWFLAFDRTEAEVEAEARRADVRGQDAGRR